MTAPHTNPSPSRRPATSGSLGESAPLVPGQQTILEQIATGAPLAEVLDSIVRHVESQSEGLLCSVLLVDEEGGSLRHGAAPNLPAAYSAAIDGIAIGPASGSCGTAAYRRLPIVVSDIAGDPLWAGFRDLALTHGLRACWSTPILGRDGRVLGCIAMYYGEPRSPTPEDEAIAARATHLATIALERERAERMRARMLEDQAARAHAERLQAELQRRFEEVPAAVCVMRGPQHIYTLANPRYRQLIGGRDPIGKTIREALPELEGQGVYELLDGVYATGEPYVGENLPVMLDRSGTGQTEEAYFTFICQPTRDENGSVDGIFVHAVEVTKQVRAEAELRRNLNILRAVTEGTTDAIFVKDLDGRYLMMNSAAAQVLGTTPEQTLGKDDTAFFSPDTGAAVMASDRAIMQSGRTQSVEEVVTVGTTTRTYLSTKGPYRDENGNVIGLIGISRDISERKRAELGQRFLAEASKTLSASLDYEQTLRRIAQLAVPDLADWCVVDVAEPDPSVPTGRRLRRLAAAHVDPSKVQLARDLNERYPPDPQARIGAPSVLRTGRPELVPEISAELLEQAARSREHLEILRQLAPRSYIAVPLKLQERTFGVLTLASAESGRRFDESDLALAEELAYRAAVAIHNAELYRELQERADAQLQLNTALREAAEARDRAIADLKLALRTRDEFLSAAAHDLKTPLAGVKATAQFLQRRLARTASPPEGTVLLQGLRSLDQSATRMTALIDELLDLARAEMGRPLALEPSTVDLVTLAQEAADELGVAYSSHRVIVRADTSSAVGEWDEPRLRRVLDNLLSNALKYSPDGGEVTITVSTELDESDPANRPHAVLRVTDRGIGIPAPDLPYIFDRFHRGGNAIGQIAGTGIGLASARTIVESHGGTIAAESQEGRGTTITVRLPLRPPPAVSTRTVS